MFLERDAPLCGSSALRIPLGPKLRYMLLEQPPWINEGLQSTYCRLLLFSFFSILAHSLDVREPLLGYSSLLLASSPSELVPLPKALGEFSSDATNPLCSSLALSLVLGSQDNYNQCCETSHTPQTAAARTR